MVGQSNRDKASPDVIKAMLKNTEKLVLLNKTELGTDFPL